MKDLTLALLQIDVIWESAAANRTLIEEKLELLPKSVDLVLLPEMFTTGFSMDPQGMEETMDGPTIEWMKAMGKKYACVFMGSLIIQDGDEYFNRMVAVGAEGVLGYYDKRHLFRMSGENDIYGQGKSRTVVTVNGWKVCMMVCYDLRFPVWSRNRLGRTDEGSYDLLVYVANWPEARAYHWKNLLLARAIENQAYVAGVNRVGTDGNNLKYAGDSAIIDPRGALLTTASQTPQLLVSTLSYESMVAYRESFPAWQDADRFMFF